MPNPVIILTDSSAYLPPETLAGKPIRVMSLVLTWDGKAYRDGVDIQAAEFYQRLSTATTLPQTSQVSIGEIQESLATLIAEGYDVLVLPVSSGISSTYQTAESVVRTFPAERVSILDTKLVSMALGFMVLAAARAAEAGASLAKCRAVAEQMYGKIGVFFTVNTLKYLAAGGRINSARRLLGSAINIKPILQIRDGKIELVTSVISRRKAVERMLDLVEEEIGGRSPVRISIFHALAPDAAQELLETARSRFSPVECILAEVSPAIGSHVGPGTLCIAYQAGEEEPVRAAARDLETARQAG